MTDHHEHRPVHHLPLEDALFSVRRALSAMRAITLASLPPDQQTRLSRIAAALSDIAEELAR